MKIKYENKFFIYDEPHIISFKYVIKKCLDLAKVIVYRLAIFFIKSKKITEKKYKVSICAIFKNEAQYIDEWIRYHKLVGVEHFYLYNNNSEDDYLSVLQQYIDEGTVTLTQWPQQQGQASAYKNFFSLYYGESKWVGFLDLDEFVNPLDYDDIYSFLKPFEKKYGSVLVYWKIFGTSGRQDRDRKGLVTKDFTSCWPKHTDIGKSFVNTAYEPDINKDLIHSFYTKRGPISVPPVNSFGKITSYCRHKAKKDFSIQINHYFTKSFQEFQEKRSRGDACFVINPRTDEYFHAHEDKCTDKDSSIYRFIPRLENK